MYSQYEGIFSRYWQWNQTHYHSNHPINITRIFHVETTWKRSFPRRFNVEYTCCICSMLAEEDYLAETHTIQISTCHRFASICFTERQMLKEFCEAEHLQPPDIYVKFEPDYHTKIRISIGNIPKKQKHPPIRLHIQPLFEKYTT